MKSYGIVTCLHATIGKITKKATVFIQWENLHRNVINGDRNTKRVKHGVICVLHRKISYLWDPLSRQQENPSIVVLCGQSNLILNRKHFPSNQIGFSILFLRKKNKVTIEKQNIKERRKNLF